MDSATAASSQHWDFGYRDERYRLRFVPGTTVQLHRLDRASGAVLAAIGPTQTVRIGPREFLWGADRLSDAIRRVDLPDNAVRRAVVAYLSLAAQAVVLMSQPLVAADPQVPPQPSLDCAA